MKVLLTGVTGFLGSHTTIQLLEKGYDVVGTLRNMNRADEIRDVIAKHTKNESRLTIVEADLNDPAEKWEILLEGIDYVQHVASPFPRVLPKKESDLLIPAREGTLKILKAATVNKVKKVVITSSSGAIVYGKTGQSLDRKFTEEDWTDINDKKDSTPYFRSKTAAEKAAWDFMGDYDGDMTIATVCPGAILGPVLEKDFGTSANIVIKTMDGSSPAVPKIGFDIVDVRSVADLLILAMEKDEANNQRFVGSNGFMSFKKVADILREIYPDKKIPKGMVPNFGVRLLSNFDSTLKPILIDLGKRREVDNSKAKELLGWEPIDNKEAVLSCAESVIRLGIV